MTEIERIKDKQATTFQLKILVCGRIKTHEATQNTVGDEFQVHLEEAHSSKWHESRAQHGEF